MWVSGISHLQTNHNVIMQKFEYSMTTQCDRHDSLACTSANVASDMTSNMQK